ncbi:MAG: porin [Alphaproteobacteria bacterium]
MRKQLLSTTALVAASLITAAGTAQAQKAQAPKFEVKGFMEQTFGAAFGLEEGAIGRRVTFDQFNETEIHFIGTATLDNGITFRAVVELEGDGDGTPAPFTGAGAGTDVIDESYLQIRGAFGQINLGSTDSAATLGTTGYLGSWATQVGQNLLFDTGDWIPAPPGTRITPDGAISDVRLRSSADDSDMITYFTPRFFGFQFGASYIPNVEQDANLSVATTDSVYNNGYALALNFDQKFDQVHIGLATGFLHWSAPDAGTNPDAKAWNIGGSVEFMGFKLAGAYKRQWDFRDGFGASTTTSLSGNRWEVGARYTFGPNAVSVVYGRGEQERLISNPNDEELRNLMAAYRRALGPGVFWYMNFTWADYDGEDRRAVAAATTDDNSGYAISTGIRLNF